MNNPQQQSPSMAADTDEDLITLADLLDVILSARWLIGIITAIFLFCGVFYALTATPIYQADSLLQVEEEKSSISGLEIGDILEGTDPSITAEIELLRSRLVLGAAVDELGLDITVEPHYFPLIGAAMARRYSEAGAADAWLGMDSYAWGGESIRVDTLQLPKRLIGVPLTLEAGQSGAFTLMDAEGEALVSGKVDETAAAGVGDNAVSVFISELTARAGTEFTVWRLPRLPVVEALQRDLNISEKGKSSGVLSIRLDGPNPANIRDTVNEIANIYVRQNVERKSAEAEKTLRFLDQQLPEIKRQMEVAEVALNNYRLDNGSIDLPLETQALLEQVVTAEEELMQLQQQRDGLGQRFTENHPMILALDEQIARVGRSVEGLNAHIQKLPNTQQEILRLHREVQVSTELYTALLNNAQELRVVKAGTVGNVRVVDYAETPYRPIKPKKAMAVLLSLLLGLFAGIVAAFVRKALLGGVEDPDLIENKTGIPVYSVIGHSRRQARLVKKVRAGEEEHGILALVDQHDPSIESIRNLRTALHFGMMEVKNNIILITGPSPAVGKSFVSLNLAAVLAAGGKKVLLIDADLRKGHLHEAFKLNRERGLTDFIRGDIKIGEVFNKTAVPGVDLITTGALPPNPSEMLLHKRLDNLFKVLGEQYDHVIVDTAPVLAVTDASIIGQLVGATLMVLKAGTHPMREIDMSIKRLRQANVNLRGILFNDVQLTSRRYGAGKYSYQYSYDK